MTTNYTLLTAEKCLPISRNQLYEDVIFNEKYGPVHDIWLCPGHIFVGLKRGNQLITFDAKNTTQDENKGCLDLNNLGSPIVNILISDKICNLIYMIHKNGMVQCWKYRVDCTWTLLQSFNVCNSNRAEISSICLHPLHNALYWCEKRATSSNGQPSYCICKRKLPEDEEKLLEKDLGSVEAVMHNICQCKLYPVRLGLAIVIKSIPPLVSMVICWQYSSNSVTMYSGPYSLKIEETSPTQAIDFISLAFKFITISIKVKEKYTMKGIAYNAQQMDIFVLEEGNVMRRVPCSKDKCEDEIQLEDPERELNDPVWFCHQNYIGCVCESEIHLYDISTGNLKDTLAIPSGSNVQGLCCCCPTFVWPAVFCKGSIYFLVEQKTQNKVDMDSMLSSDNFQTVALEIAQLEKKKTENPTTSVQTKLKELYELWQQSKDKKPTTKLAEIVGPYLEEYWNLESVDLASFKPTVVVCPSTIQEEVLHVLHPKTSITMSARQACLLILAKSYPNEVLGILESQMDFDTDDISASQIHRWQGILAQDSSVSPVSSDVAVPMFEHICRLLYRLQSSRLVNFVKICQMINDQRVGVSAFIRKRQAIQYYERAVTCLNDIRFQSNSPESTTAYVQLLLASKQDNCEMKALKFYIDCKQWDKSLDLLREYRDNSQLHSRLFYSLLTSMNNEGVLTKYAESVFTLMPDIKSFMSVSSVVSSSSTKPTAADVFSSSSSTNPTAADVFSSSSTKPTAADVFSSSSTKPTAADVFSATAVPFGLFKPILQSKLLDSVPEK